MKLSSILICLGIAAVICLLILVPGPDMKAREVERQKATKESVERSIFFVEKSGYQFAVIVWEGRGSDAISMTQLDPRKRELLPGDKER